jgi:hypothetical protein
MLFSRHISRHESTGRNPVVSGKRAAPSAEDIEKASLHQGDELVALDGGAVEEDGEGGEGSPGPLLL